MAVENSLIDSRSCTMEKYIHIDVSVAFLDTFERQLLAVRDIGLSYQRTSAVQQIPDLQVQICDGPQVAELKF
jgi:hypothetical protein